MEKLASGEFVSATGSRRAASRRTAIAAWVARHRLALAVALALALRILLWTQPLHQLANDEVEYVAVARDLLAGRGWQFYDHYHWLRAPLYPLFLAASLWLAGGDLHRAALPNIALSVATVYLAERLARALVGRRAAFLAALGVALLWTLVTFASLYMSETLFTFLFIGALCCLARAGSRGGWRAAAGAGVLLGLATLTRSITLLFLPVAGLWLLAALAPAPRRMAWPGVRAPACAALVVLCAAAVIAPWSIRNYRAYGRLIPVETGLSYNLWAFNEPRESSDAIFRTLEQIHNPAERSDYATAKGLARLREDPAILLRKLWPDWIYLWRVKPIEDRFIQESYYADVGLPLFGSALLLDDALYLLIALAGVAGLALYRPGGARGAARLLMIAWLLYVVATVLLTHGEARYRHFLFPALIPYAAWAITRARRGVSIPVGTWPRWLIAAGVGALIAWPALVYYPWIWAAQNTARGWHALAGDIAWDAGGREAALREYRRALDAQETPDGWLRIGDAARATGDEAGALAAYRAANRLTPSYIAASARLGDLLRAMGDQAGARDAFEGQYADAQRVVDWAWRELRSPPPDRLDIGGGLDFGYVGGVYSAEVQQGATARWTDGAGEIRLSSGAGPLVVRLRLAAPRPDLGDVPAQVCAGGRCWQIAIGPRWRSYSLLINDPDGGPLLVEVRSATFDAPDGRRLGVLIDSADVARP